MVLVLALSTLSVMIRNLSEKGLPILGDLPGLGRLTVDAVLSRDYPLIQGFILFFATVVALASVVIDIAYAFLDPRIRYS